MSGKEKSPLTKFLDDEYEGSREMFAKAINSTTASLSRYENGERIPNRVTMKLIYDVSNGRVSPNSFYGVKEQPAA
jgi:DNA-binding transcriptional regulator YiaG